MRSRYLAVAMLLLVAGCTAGPSPTLSFDNESLDYQVPPTNRIRTADFDAPTPLRIEGAQTITTMELRDQLASAAPPLLIDVLEDRPDTLPGAFAVPGSGGGSGLNDPVQKSFGAAVAKLTRGDKTRPLVVFCLSRLCWLSHNAAVRLVALGYSHVSWYRGGRNAWREAGLPMVPVRRVAS